MVRYSESHRQQAQLWQLLILLMTGFHNGVRLWRGYFNGTATGIFLNVQGGYAL